MKILTPDDKNKILIDDIPEDAFYALLEDIRQFIQLYESFGNIKPEQSGGSDSERKKQ